MEAGELVFSLKPSSIKHYEAGLGVLVEKRIDEGLLIGN